MTRSFEKRVDDFCADGFLVVRGAVAPDIVLADSEVCAVERAILRGLE